MAGPSKAFVLQHMNADHRDDLALYLRHFNGLSAQQLAAEGTPELVDMTLDALLIRTASSGAIHSVALQPPLASWADCRPRFIAMSSEAHPAKELAKAETKAMAPAKTTPRHVPYHLPQGFEIVVMAGVLWYGVSATLVATAHDRLLAKLWAAALAAVGVVPASPTWLGLLAGEDGFRFVVRLIFLPVLLIHVTETWWFARTRLQPNGMRCSNRDALLWMLSCFSEGLGCFRRFDRLLAVTDRH